MDHGKDPYLLLVKLTLMLMIGPLIETYYHSCVCWINDLERFN